MNRSKLAAVVLGGLAILWASALFFGLPFLYGKKIDALTGHPMDTVRKELGEPTREWTSEQFACDPAWPCKGKALGGPVLLYGEKENEQGWYLYFDQTATLRSLEKVK